MPEFGIPAKGLASVAMVLSCVSATPVAAQQNPGMWRAQTTMFVGGSTHGAEGELPVTPLVAIRVDGSVKGYFWLGAEVSWTFERDLIVPVDASVDFGTTTPYDAVITSLLVARLVPIHK